MIAVTLPKQFNKNLINSTKKQSVANWLKQGITIQQPQQINQTLKAYITQPGSGPAFMVFDNFPVLKKME